MANNRLWLVHRPTGKSVALGKRLSVGWYLTWPEELGTRVQEFFNEIAGEFPQDDFVLAIEEASEAPLCTDKFSYGADNKPHLSE